MRDRILALKKECEAKGHQLVYTGSAIFSQSKLRYRKGHISRHAHLSDYSCE